MGEPAVTIVGLGDSTTAGAPEHTSPAEAPPDGAGDPRSQYAYWLMERHPDWRVHNRGIGGERSDEILARFDRHVLALQPQIVVILAGVNDLYQGASVDRVTGQLQAMYARAVAAHLRVVACTILPYDGSSPMVQARMQRVNDWIRAYAAEHGLAFCDLFAAMEDPHRPGRLVSTMDGMHPDVDGYRRMADALEPVLVQVIAALHTP